MAKASEKLKMRGVSAKRRRRNGESLKIMKAAYENGGAKHHIGEKRWRNEAS